MFLDDLPIIHSHTDYGNIGLHGYLGVEKYHISVLGRHYEHSIAAHANSIVEFDLDKKQGSFHTQVAMNDVPGMNPAADFFVFADDVLVACACGVTAHEPPRALSASILGAQKLKLVTKSEDTSHKFSLWLNPTVSSEPLMRLQGPLGGFNLFLPQPPIPPCGLCIVTVVTPNFVEMAYDMLGSLYKNGEVKHAQIVIIAFDPNDEIRQLATHFGATIIEGENLNGPSGISLKTAVYMIPKLVQAEKYLLIDSDTFILGSLQPPLAALDEIPDTSMFVCREVGVPKEMKLGTALLATQYPYFAEEGDQHILPIKTEGNYGHVINTGVIFTRAAALLAAEEQMRSMMPASAVWNSKRQEIGWREQGLFNLAVARLDCVSDLDERYNLQVLKRKVELHGHLEHTSATCDGRLVTVLHFNGIPGKQFYDQVCRGRFRHVSSPKFSSMGSGDLGVVKQCVSTYMGSNGKAAKTRLGILHSVQPERYVDLFKPLCNGDPPTSVLSIDNVNGVLPVLFASRGCPNVSVYTDNQFNTCTDMVQLAGETIQERITCHVGDVSSMLAQAEKNPVDVITIDIKGNIKRVMTHIMMAQRFADQNTIVLLSDLQYPTCDLDVLTKKLRDLNWIVETVSVVPYGPSLLRVYFSR